MKREPLTTRLPSLDEEGLAVAEGQSPPAPEIVQHAGSVATGREVETTMNSIAAVTADVMPAPRVLRGVMAEVRRQKQRRHTTTPRTAL